MQNLVALKSELFQLLTEKSVCRGEFTLVSGAKSDIYVDSKLTTLDPKGAFLVGQVGWDIVKNAAKTRGVNVTAIGGLTMGADPIALSIGISSYIEDSTAAIQTFSVRKAPKKHGRNKLIEGNFKAGDAVVVVDDVITTGGSTLQAIDAVEAAGGKVAFVVVLVDRQEQNGRNNIERRGCPVEAIFTRADLMAAELKGLSPFA